MVDELTPLSEVIADNKSDEDKTATANEKTEGKGRKRTKRLMTFE